MLENITFEDFGFSVSPEELDRIWKQVGPMRAAGDSEEKLDAFWDQTVETWLRCHVRAFEFFGGVPRRIILDNLKSSS